MLGFFETIPPRGASHPTEPRAPAAIGAEADIKLADEEDDGEWITMRHAISNIEVSSPKLKALLDAYERQLIQSALIATAGNQRRAAASLGLLPTTLHEKMKRLGLVRRPQRAASAEPEMRGPEPEELGQA